MNESITLSDGESACRVIEAGKERIAPILELAVSGARLGPGLTSQPGSYIDCVLAIKGMEPRQLFASVVERSAQGTQVRWMFFEAGDEDIMRQLIQSMRTSAAGSHHSTRRIIRPTGGQKPITDSALPPATAPAQPAAGDAQAPGAPPAAGRTRRIVKPTNTKLDAPASDAVATSAVAPAAAPSATPAETPAATPAPASGNVVGEDSGAARIPVALATTDKFTKLDDIEADKKIEAAATTAPVIGADGRMDVAAALKSRSKTVRASELAARHDKVRVLNFSTIRALIQEAVEEAAGHLTRSLGEAERKRLLSEAEAGFQERMQAFEAEKLSADARSAKLAEQLRTAQELLESERKRAVTSDQFTMSAAGIEALDDQLRRGLDRAIAGKGVTPELEDQLRKLVAHLLDSEREKMKTKEQEAQNAAIALLEKKISRLSTTLEDAERERDEAREFAAMVEASGGGAVSMQKFKAGIKGDDANKKRKLELMKELAEQNRELRRALGIQLNAAAATASSAAVDSSAAVEPPASEAPAAPVAPEPAAAAPAEAQPEATAAAEPPLPNPDDEAWQPTGDAAPEINPDDLPWEAPATSVAASAFRKPGAS